MLFHRPRCPGEITALHVLTGPDHPAGPMVVDASASTSSMRALGVVRHDVGDAVVEA